MADDITFDAAFFFVREFYKLRMDPIMIKIELSI